MKNKPVAIVLGGVSAHIPLIKKLQERGYYTVLVDYYENPPAKIHSDEHILESTLDREKVLAIAIRYRAELVICACLDQPIPIACYVSEKLGLPFPYVYETALDVTNKKAMKKKMFESGIPTSRYVIIDDKNKAKVISSLDLDFPVIIKPTDNTGALGVGKANSKIELPSLLHEALQQSKRGEIIVEEFLEGDEVNIYCYVQKRKAQLLLISKKYKMEDYGNPGMQGIGSITPATISENCKKKILQVANNVVASFMLDSTPLLIQGVVSGDEFSIIEIAARIGGSIGYRIVSLYTGLNLMDAIVNSYLGLETKIVLSQSRKFYATNFIYSSPGVFNEVKGIRTLIDQGIIEEFHPLKTKGMVIYPGTLSRAKIGAFIVTTHEVTELYEKIEIAVDKLEVYDINDSLIMRKDIFLKPV